MSLPIYQRVAVTDAGDVIPGAEYTVINENTGVAQPIYSDRTGATLLTPPYFADSVGTIQFFIAQGTTFRVAASGGVGTYTDRYIYAAHPQSNATDTTTGSLMAVGAFGLGAPALLITTDLNSLTVAGKYFIATTNANHPNTGKAGLLDVTSGISGTVRTLQKFVTYTDDAEFTRSNSGTTWGAWKQTNPQAFGLGVDAVPVATNNNCNDITISGDYYGSGGSTANLPESGLSWQISHKSTFSVDFATQEAIAYGGSVPTNSNKKYLRHKDNGVWEAWNEVITADAAGNVLFGCTSVPDGTISGMAWAATGDESLKIGGAGTGGDFHIRFYNGNGNVGNIISSGSSTTYATSSDYRLKENDVPMTGATERVKALRPINFAWKVDGSRVDGFFAHELAEVVPEAATGTKDAMIDEEYEVTPAVYEDVTTPAVEAVLDEDGVVITEAIEESTESFLVTKAVMGTRSVPDYQGIDQSKLVPLLTATIQELIARIEALEAGA